MFTSLDFGYCRGSPNVCLRTRRNRSRPHDAVFVGAIMEAVAENRCMMPLLVPVRERGEVSITTIQ